MDKTLNGITWFENMYQKFEAACLEVDDIVHQEAIQYLENRVQTVSSNVKQFCTEFMEEVLNPSQMVEKEQVDLSLNQKTEVEGDETSKEVCSPSLQPSTDVCSGLLVEQSCDHLKVKVTDNHVQGHMTECKPTIEAMVDDDSSSYITSTRASEPVELTQCHKSGILESAKSPNSLESAEKPDTGDLELNPSTTVINDETLQSNDVCVSLVGGVADNPTVEELVEWEIKSLNTQEGEGSADSLPTTGSEVKLLDNDYTPDNIFVEPADESKDVESKHAIEMESLEVFDTATLEGSCIIIDCSERHSLTNERKGGRSYKKKLKQAFSRSMLARRVQQQGNASEPSILDGCSEASNLKSGDSDWELV